MPISFNDLHYILSIIDESSRTAGSHNW